MGLLSRLRARYRHRCVLWNISKGETIKLEVGSGSDPQPGYVHLDDVEDAPSLDILAGLDDPIPLPDGCATEILASHFVERVGREKAPAFFQEIHRVLAAKGKVRLWVTDGDQDRLTALLRNAGFEQVRRVKGLAARVPAEIPLEAIGSDASRSAIFVARPAVLSLVAGRIAAAREALGQLRTRFSRLLAAVSYGWFRAFRRRKVRISGPPRDPRRGFVFNMGGIGDFAAMAPFLKEIRSAFPGLKLSIVYNARIHEIALWRDYYDEAFPIKAQSDFCDAYATASVSDYRVFRLHVGLIRELAKSRFDIGWVFGLNEATGNLGTILADLVGVQYCIGVHYGDFTDRLQVFTIPDDPNPNIYSLYAQGLKPLGRSAKRVPAQVRIDKEARDWAATFLATSGLEEAQPKIIVNPGSGGMVNTRCWPPERFAAIADRIEGFIGAPVIITGGPDQVHLARTIAERMKTDPVVAVGAAGMSQFCALLSLADLVITNDTSALHLAAASGAPRILTLFGPTHYSKFITDDDRYEIIQSMLECSPCAKVDGNDPSSKCRRPIVEECMKSISVSDVWERLEPILMQLMKQRLAAR